MSSFKGPAASLKKAKERLTLEDLSSYDDILTDALVDHVRLSLFFLSLSRYAYTNVALRSTTGLLYQRIEAGTIHLAVFGRKM